MTSRSQTGSKRRSYAGRIIFTAIAVVVLATLAFIAANYFRGGSNEKPSSDDQKHPPKQQLTKKKTTSTKPATDVVVSEKPTSVAVDPKPVVTGDWQMVNGFKVPKGARLVRNSLTNRQVRVFQRATDTLIASYLQPPSGGIMPPPMPIPGNAGKKFLESLDTPIEILDTDSDEICRMKEAVIVARAQIKQMMDEGQSFEAILADHYRLTEENTRIRRDAQKELDAIHAQGDAKGAEKYRRTIDLALQQMGIDPLDEPMTNAEKKRKRHLENEAKENSEQGENEL